MTRETTLDSWRLRWGLMCVVDPSITASGAQVTTH